MYWICLESLIEIFLVFKSLILLLRPIVPVFLCHFLKKIKLDYYVEIYSQLLNSMNLYITFISLVAFILKTLWLQYMSLFCAWTQRLSFLSFPPESVSSHQFSHSSMHLRIPQTIDDRIEHGCDYSIEKGNQFAKSRIFGLGLHIHEKDCPIKHSHHRYVG